MSDKCLSVVLCPLQYVESYTGDMYAVYIFRTDATLVLIERMAALYK